MKDQLLYDELTGSLLDQAVADRYSDEDQYGWKRPGEFIKAAYEDGWVDASEAAAQIVANRKPFGDAEVDRLARWMYGQEFLDCPYDRLTPGSQRTWREGARRRLSAAFALDTASDPVPQGQPALGRNNDWEIE